MLLESSGVTSEQLSTYQGGEIIARCLDHIKANAQKLKESPNRNENAKSKVMGNIQSRKNAKITQKKIEDQKFG